MSATDLRDAYLARREELDLNQMDVALAGGPSTTWQSQLIAGSVDRLRGAEAKKLDRALRWVPGSARKVWTGTGTAEALLRVDDPLATLRAEIQRAELDEATRRRLLTALEGSSDVG